MKQVLQDLRAGHTRLVDVPAPQVRRGCLLIVTRRSLISAGTERMLVEFGQANLLAKAKAQPDKVRQVLDKLRTDGLLPTLEAVFARLDQPLPLGYCNAGVVLEVGEGVTGFSVGDRVISNGPHAEVVCVPQTLCARIPEGVSDDEAAFTVLAAVALQGIRLAAPTLGENVAVIGLGLVGLMTVQMLIANGCRVLGVDFGLPPSIPPTGGEESVEQEDDARAGPLPPTGGDEGGGKLALAQQFGAQTVDLGAGGDPVQAGLAFSNGNGMDAVLITASTKSSDPVHQAAQMSRKRGRIVLVGVTGLELSRADFYEKELTFQVSCSYGPGRYDPAYEQQGRDYPYGLVRWTEQRNFQAVLNLMADKRMDVAPLISARVPQAEAPAAYQRLTEDHALLGVLLTYPEQGIDLSRTVSYQSSAISSQPSATSNQRPASSNQLPATSIQLPTSSIQLPTSSFQLPASSIQYPVVGMIGAGNFASLVLLPALAKTPAVLKSIASAGGTSATLAARKFGFAQATTDYRVLLEDPEINTLFIATRHNLHARLVIEALQAGKHVFVEKPLALNRAELQAVAAAYRDAHISEMEPQDGHPTGNSQLASRISQPASRNSQPATRNPQLATRNSQPSLMVGFNRRFSPLAVKMRALLQARSQPVSAIYTVNAGAIPPEHWVHDPQVGGGRVIGEGCHFIDLLRYLVAAPIVGVEAQMMGAAAGVAVREDKMTIHLAFEDGSMGTVHYLANGSKRYPKERVEVFSAGRVLVLDNFKTLQGYGWPGFARQRLWRQDKGHAAEVAAFVERVRSGGEWLIPWQELEEVTLASFAAVEAAAKPPEALFGAGGSLCPLQAA